MSTRKTLRIIYAPHKAFKELSQEKKVGGLILVAILFVVGYTSFSYAFSSKIYDEQTIPAAAKLDEWTENTTLWTSNANKALSDDSIMKNQSLANSFFGNKSIQFQTFSQSQIWVQINNVGPINTTGTAGYKNVSIRIKTFDPYNLQLANVSLYLFTSPADFFRYNIPANSVKSNITKWNNLTIQLGPNKGWTSIGASANWSQINGLRLEFTWSENSDYTVRLDGLFFRGIYQPFLTDPTNYTLISLSSGFMKFVFTWIILAGAVYILIKFSGGQIVWKTALVIVALCLLTYFIEWIIDTAIFSTLPTMYRPVELFGPAGERELASQRISEQIGYARQMALYASQILFMAWNIILLAFATRALSDLSWWRCATIALVAYFLNFMAQGFISILFGV